MKQLGLVLVMSAFVIGGCGPVSYSLSEIEEPNEKVSVERSKFSFLWLSPIKMNEASELVDELKAKCDGGQVTGIMARSSAAWAVIGQVEKLELTGYCTDD